LIKNEKIEKKGIKFMEKEELIKNSDVIVLSVPVTVMPKVLEEVYPFLNKYSKKEKKLLVDICSVKKHVIEKFEELNKKEKALFSYLSIHPMFGPGLKEVKGQTILINYAYNVEEQFLELIKNYWIEKGFNVLNLDYKKHDKIMALIQGLNHFNIFVSAKVLEEVAKENNLSIKELKKLASPSYSIFITFFTRYVLQNEKLYSEIQITNEYNNEIIEKFLSIAKELANFVKNKDKEKIEEFIRKMKPFYEENKEDYEKSQKLIEFYSKLT
jgi:prephenate dehydrogenase